MNRNFIIKLGGFNMGTLVLNSLLHVKGLTIYRKMILSIILESWHRQEQDRDEHTVRINNYDLIEKTGFNFSTCVKNISWFCSKGFLFTTADPEIFKFDAEKIYDLIDKGKVQSRKNKKQLLLDDKKVTIEDLNSNPESEENLLRIKRREDAKTLIQQQAVVVDKPVAEKETVIEQPIMIEDVEPVTVVEHKDYTPFDFEIPSEQYAGKIPDYEEEGYMTALAEEMIYGATEMGEWTVVDVVDEQYLKYTDKPNLVTGILLMWNNLNKDEVINYLCNNMNYYKFTPNQIEEDLMGLIRSNNVFGFIKYIKHYYENKILMKLEERGKKINNHVEQREFVEQQSEAELAYNIEQYELQSRMLQTSQVEERRKKVKRNCNI